MKVYMQYTEPMETRLVMEFSPTEIFNSREFIETVIKEAGRAIADHIIQNHSIEITEKISQQAIATTAVAMAGAEINDTLKKKLPDRIDRIVDKQVYQRGIFGGVKRIS